MRHKIFMWKTPTNCENKKSRDIRPINRNPLFEIKSHRGPAFFTCVPTRSERLVFYLVKINFRKVGVTTYFNLF